MPACRFRNAPVTLSFLPLVSTCKCYIALLRPPSLPRACAIFLISYCAVASYTEVGLGDASPYLLHLAVAASLLAAPAEAVPLPAPEERRRRLTLSRSREARRTANQGPELEVA